MTKSEVIKKLVSQLIQVTLVLFLVLVQLFAMTPAVSAAEDTCTWTGAVNGNWSNGGNWSGCDNGGVPQTGDNLIFPSSASNKATTNDLSITIDYLEIAPGATGYTISGNTVSAGGNIEINGEVEFATGIQYVGNNTSHRLDVYSFDGSFSLPATIDLNLTGGSADFLVYSDLSNFPLPTFTGTTNTFSVMSNSPYNTFIMSTDSTFTAPGGVYIQNSSVNCQADNCLGDDANPVVIIFGNASAGSELLLWVTGLTLPYNIRLDNGGIAAGRPSIRLAGNSGVLSGNLTVDSDAIISTGTNGTLSVGGSTALAADTTLTASSSIVSSNIVLLGAVTGGGTLAVTNASLSAPADNSSYTGLIRVEADGTFTGSVNSFGTTANGVVVQDGGILRFNTVGADIGVDDAISIVGAGNDHAPAALVNFGDNVTIAGTVTLAGNTTVANYSNGDSLAFSGRITGTGNLTYIGDTTNNGFLLAGSTANDYTGATTVNNTHLALAKSAGIEAVPGNLTITGGATHESSVGVNATEQIADDAVVTVNNGTNAGFFSINGTRTETVATVTGNGWIEMDNGGATLILGTADGVFTGHIQSANAPILKAGSGTWDIQGVNEDAGTGFVDFEIAEGELLANFADASGAQSEFDVTGGTLGGSGIVGTTAISEGTVSPGNSPGCLNPSGSFSILADATMIIEIAGATACSGYDQVAATGAVTIDNATLSLVPSYTPADGAVLTIISGSSIAGQFSGLSNGATIDASGLKFRINYTANSVTLTYLSGTLTSNDSLLAKTGVDVHLVGLAILLLVSTGFGLNLQGLRHFRLELKR